MANTSVERLGAVTGEYHYVHEVSGPGIKINKVVKTPWTSRLCPGPAAQSPPVTATVSLALVTVQVREMPSRFRESSGFSFVPFLVLVSHRLLLRVVILCLNPPQVPHHTGNLLHSLVAACPPFWGTVPRGGERVHYASLALRGPEDTVRASTPTCSRSPRGNAIHPVPSDRRSSSPHAQADTAHPPHGARPQHSRSRCSHTRAFHHRHHGPPGFLRMAVLIFEGFVCHLRHHFVIPATAPPPTPTTPPPTPHHHTHTHTPHTTLTLTEIT
ncbi:unnamed protein product [Pleuronectes platessa]|uniref:Uncharacterized protein n=1 Tax=Pleuronectes platessa TaxID=8262 RepID=A0A9N7YSQ3_PLEPL|nr:unnamed protein product [Pleuronectes platessa]